MTSEPQPDNPAPPPAGGIETLKTGGRLVVISGPSGAGKSSVLERLLELPGFCHSTSATTRSRRAGEKEGFHYSFVDEATFEEMVREGRFLEHATVHGNRYGTPIQNVQSIVDRGDLCVLDIDVQGGRTLRQRGLDAHFVFVAPPSLKELERRLRARGTDTEASIQERLSNAEREIEEGKQYDLNVTNVDLTESVQEVLSFLHRRGIHPTGEAPPRAEGGSGS